MSKYSMKYNGLRKRSDYEDLLDGILNPKQIVKYPNRDATNALNHPYLNQFRGEFDEMSEQDKALKKAKTMLLAMQGLIAPMNTQGTNTTPPPSLMPSTPSSHSVASSFFNGINQTHNIMSGGAAHMSSTLNSPRISTLSDRDIPMMSSSQLLQYANATTNQDSRMYQAVSERDPNIASGSGHQVADAVHENIVETLTGAVAQRAAVTGGIFQEPPESFNIGTPEIQPLELSLAPSPEKEILLPPPAQQSSSAAAASAAAAADDDDVPSYQPSLTWQAMNNFGLFSAAKDVESVYNISYEKGIYTRQTDLTLLNAALKTREVKDHALYKIENKKASDEVFKGTETQKRPKGQPPWRVSLDVGRLTMWYFDEAYLKKHPPRK